jgi:hypothetical protein
MLCRDSVFYVNCVYTLYLFWLCFVSLWRTTLAIRKRLPDDNIDWLKYAGNLLKVSKTRYMYFDGIFLRTYLWLTCCVTSLFSRYSVVICSGSFKSSLHGATSVEMRKLSVESKKKLNLEDNLGWCTANCSRPIITHLAVLPRLLSKKNQIIYLHIHITCSVF